MRDERKMVEMVWKREKEGGVLDKKERREEMEESMREIKRRIENEDIRRK